MVWDGMDGTWRGEDILSAFWKDSVVHCHTFCMELGRLLEWLEQYSDTCAAICGWFF